MGRMRLPKVPMKKKKRNPIKALRARIWEVCKDIVRSRYGNVCYSCGRKGLSGVNWHTGHLIPKSVCGAYLKYDVRNLRPQCYNCNINLGGNGAEFLRQMIAREGQEYVDALFADKKKVCKEIDRIQELLFLYGNGGFDAA